MQHEADRHQIVVEVIEERAAAGRAIERPAERMLHQALAVFLRRDLPKFFQSEPEFLRIARVGQAETRDQLLAEIAARAFREQRVFGAQLHAAREAVLALLVLGMPMSPVATPATLPCIVEQDFGGGKARIDFDPERFRLAGEPAADAAERDDEVAVIAHQRRHQEIGQPQRAAGRQKIEAVLGDLGFDRRVLGAPIGQQAIEPDRIDHRAREDMGADLGALLHHHDRDVRIDLLEADGGAEPGRAGADNHHVEFHRLAGGQVGHAVLRKSFSHFCTPAAIARATVADRANLQSRCQPMTKRRENCSTSIWKPAPMRCSAKRRWTDLRAG